MPGGAAGNPTATPPGGTIAGSVLPLRRAEELIATLPGVLSVRIVPGETGAIDEVHVLTTDAIAPKSTVRNIESALMAQLGLRVNHRKISVATTLDAPRALDRPDLAPTGVAASPAASAVASTVASTVASAAAVASPAVPAPAVSPEPPVAPTSPTPVTAAPAASAPSAPPVAAPPSSPLSGAPTRRGALSPTKTLAAEGRRVLLFEDVEVRRSRTRGVLCRVTLSRDGSHFVGEAEGQETERSRIELAARATLQAIQHAIATGGEGERSLALEGAKLLDAFDRSFVFVSVAARLGRELVVLAGTCEVRESGETSAVLAVLDATNRWVHLEG